MIRNEERRVTSMVLRIRIDKLEWERRVIDTQLDLLRNLEIELKIDEDNEKSEK